MKRLICILLGAVALFSLNGAFASDQARVFINDISASAGDTVTVSVMAERASACSGGSFNVVYDSEALELVSCVKGDAMEGVAPLINTSYAEDTLRVTWMTSGSLRDGSLCDVVFRLRDGADHSLPLRLEELKLSDVNGNPVSASASGGWIVVGAGSVDVTDLSLLDYSGARIESPGPGSNRVRAEIHNTLGIPVEPVVVCTLYKNNEVVSSVVKSAGKAVGTNETATIEQVVNVPMARNIGMTVTVWDGVLNLAPIYSVSFAGE